MRHVDVGRFAKPLLAETTLRAEPSQVGGEGAERVEHPSDYRRSQTAVLETLVLEKHLRPAGASRFSPNTQQQSKPPNAAVPSDMAEVFALIEAARQGILFLLLQPGSPSVLDAILNAQVANKSLFVRGAATDPKAIGDYETQLHQRTGEVAEVAAASAVTDQFGSWQEELLKSSPGAHAIIHDKIVVIDPLSADCAVVTGSHNLGYRASYNNDENLLIVKGHRALAEAYAVHVMDVYDHYRWRWVLEQRKEAAFTGLKRTSAEWQGKYFTKLKEEVAFWL